MRRPSVEMPGYHVAAAPQGGNYFGLTNVTPVAQTNPAATCIMGGSLYVKESGIFRVSCRLPFSGGTTAKTIAHTLVTRFYAYPLPGPTVQPTAGFAGTGALATGFEGSDVGIALAAPSQVIPPQVFVLNADAAGGIGVNFNALPIDPAGAGYTTQHSETVATLTGLLTAQAAGQNNFGLDDAIIHSAGSAAKVAFPLGGFVVFGIVVTSAADVVTYQGCSFSVQEMPRS